MRLRTATKLPTTATAVMIFTVYKIKSKYTFQKCYYYFNKPRTMTIVDDVLMLLNIDDVLMLFVYNDIIT